MCFPHDALYLHDLVALALSGPLDVTAIQQAYNMLLLRHDALRMRIVFVGRQPWQVFEAATESRFQFVDCSDSGEQESIIEDRIRATIQERYDRKINFEQDALFTATLYRLTTQRHVLTFWPHHIIWDGRSLAILFQEFWSLYARHLAGDMHATPTDFMQYSEYIQWQEKMHQSQRKELLAYWEQRLSDATSLRLPVTLDDSAASVEELKICRALNNELTAKLRNRAAQTRIMLSLYALAAYAIVVSRRFEKNDLVITTTFMGRESERQAQLIGYLSFPMFLRIKFDPVSTLTQSLRLVTKEYMSSLRHRDFGSTVLDNMELYSGMLFQWFPYNWGASTQQLNVLRHRIEPFAFRSRSPSAANLYLSVTVIENNDQLSIQINYRPDVLTSAVADQIAFDMEAVLSRFATDPDDVSISRCIPA